MNCDISCQLTYSSFLLHSNIWASSLFCLKVAAMSCLLGSSWNKERRPLRGSDAGAACSEAEATAASTEFALLPVSAEAKAAAVSSLCGTLKSFGEGLSVPDSAEPALLPACLLQLESTTTGARWQKERSPCCAFVLAGVYFLVWPFSVLSSLLPHCLFLQHGGGGGGWWLASVLARPQLSLDHLEYLHVPSGRAFPRQMVASPDRWLPRDFHRVFSCFCFLDHSSRSFR